MSKSYDIQSLIVDYQVGNKTNQTEPRDSNHWVRRFFRCWIDGSYNGSDHYRSNLEYIRQNRNNKRKMRSFVISEFCQFIALEHDCHYSTAQKAIVKALTSKQLENLNNDLISDCMDFLESHEL
jgi:hypothetical protein